VSCLLTARYLVTEAGRPPIEDGALYLRGDRIVAAGRRQELAATLPAGTPIIDYGEAVLLPPLVNAHCHLELSAFPAWLATDNDRGAAASFVDWINRLVRLRRRHGSDSLPAALRTGVEELLASGTGAVGDIVSWFPGAAQIAASPLYGRLFFEVLGQRRERYAPLLEDGSAMGRALPPPLSGGLSPHAPYTLAPELLRAAVASGLPLAIHCAESPAESDFIRSSRGELAERLYPDSGWDVPAPSGHSPVTWLDAHGALTPRTLLIHGVQVDEVDAALIAQRGCSVVLCPRSNRRLVVGTAPAELYRRHGVPLALGTDSLASNDSLSLWDELAAARRDYPALTPDELLAMATSGGARALEVEMGRLAPGAAAHLQAVCLPEAVPPADLVDYLCSAGQQLRVAALWLVGHEVLAHSGTSRL